MASTSMFQDVSRLRARLGRSEWIVCAEALKLIDAAPTICGITSFCGPNGEPLACGYFALHQGPHAWESLPTWAAVALPEETPHA